ncbi:MAG: hypothetical protein ACSW8C_01115 [bacterium]
MSSSSPAIPSTTAPNTVDPTGSDQTKEATAKVLFSQGTKYVFAHKSGVSTLLQIVGSVGLILGGATLLFAGVAGVLTVAGTPLGVPLLIAGGILFGLGTVLKIAEKVEKTGLTAGQKIKEFFKDTLINIATGTALSGAFLAICKLVPLGTLILLAPIAIKLIPFLNKDLNDKDQWGKFVAIFPKDSTIGKKLEGTETLDDFLEKKLGVVKIAKGVVEYLNEKPETKQENASDVMNTSKTGHEQSPTKEELKTNEEKNSDTESEPTKSQKQKKNKHKRRADPNEDLIGLAALFAMPEGSQQQ